jgi:RHS repeat-associated protein
MPFQEGQEPDLDTTDNTDPNAGYQPPDTEEPEPTSPPDDYSDPKVGGLLPEDLPTGHSVGYYFDKAGNRQQVTDTANPTINYMVNPINQYTSVSGVSKSSITNGLEHEISSFQGLYDTHPVYYYYINDEHLKQVSDGTYNRYFFYDALDRCVKRSPTVANGGNTTYYIYDGEKPILEYSSTDIVGRNVYGKGIDEILMRTDSSVNGGQPIYYAQDHEGSVTHLINGCTTPSSQTGNVLEKYAYDAFGVPTFMDSGGNNLNPNATVYDNRFLFTGREYGATYRNMYVSTFSFYEYRARAYNPTLGRFMSEDPKLFDAGDYNLFRYCHNDPMDFTDPMGLQDADVTTNNPQQTSYVNARDAMAKWADSSNNRQISFGQFTASQGLSMGQVSESHRAPKDDGLPKRLIATNENHESALRGGLKTYRWKAVTAGGHPVKDYNMTNQERLLKGGAVAITGPRQMSSDAIMTDTVGYSGKLGDFTGTRTFTIGNTVHAYGTDTRMTTEFVDVIQFNKGLVRGVNSTAIEPGNPQYVDQH